MNLSWSEGFDFLRPSMHGVRDWASLSASRYDLFRWSGIICRGVYAICVREVKSMAQLDASLLNDVDYQHPYSDDYIKKHARFMRFYKGLPDFWVDVFGLGFGRRYRVVYDGDYYLRVEGVSC